MTNTGKEAMAIETQRMRDFAKARRMLQCFYPFDDVQIWLIDQDHVCTFARYIPVSHVPVDDVVWFKNWVNENK